MPLSFFIKFIQLNLNTFSSDFVHKESLIAFQSSWCLLNLIFRKFVFILDILKLSKFFWSIPDDGYNWGSKWKIEKQKGYVSLLIGEKFFAKSLTFINFNCIYKKSCFNEFWNIRLVQSMLCICSKKILNLWRMWSETYSSNEHEITEITFYIGYLHVWWVFIKYVILLIMLNDILCYDWMCFLMSQK